MCNCISNASPQYGTDPLVCIVGHAEMEDIGIDACIAPLIQELWNAGVETRNSCCSHNGRMGKHPSVIISDESSVSMAKTVTGGRADLFQYQLVKL